MATRTIESRRSRLITMLIIPLMSCAGRMPVYILIAGAFFPSHAGMVLLGLYALGIALAVLAAKIAAAFPEVEVKISKTHADCMKFF